MLLRNSSPRNVRAIPRSIFAKDSGAPTGRKMYSIPCSPRPLEPGMAELIRYRPLASIGIPVILTCLGLKRSTMYLRDVGDVLHIARVTPRKNPSIIPKATIFTVAMNPSRNISLVSSTKTPKLLYSGTTKPTWSSTPASSVHSIAPPSPTAIPINPVSICMWLKSESLPNGLICCETMVPPLVLIERYPPSPVIISLVVVTTSIDVSSTPRLEGFRTYSLLAGG